MREQLIQTAADVNANYRMDEGNGSLEIGFLYGTAEMVASMLISEGLSFKSFSELRQEIAEEIDAIAATGSYSLLKREKP